jgi:hypothetical protein
LYLGDTVTAQFRLGDEPFYQSYLVHTDQGVLVGSVSMQSQRIGSVATVDVWLVERDEDEAEADMPLVTFAARAAVADGVFRARLSDRELVAAEVGAQAGLATANLSLDVRVRAVAPDPEAGSLQLEALTLSVTADRAPVAAAGGGEEAEPPIPLPFRTD